ncbi:uncharacterized protein LOC142169592 [Nicotiana tabacum]|uniref:Uncharacterized protein LOC142169592 n=1 Tax=Nicotiana tabacum TaxID=4097 RepID=A0AC58SRH8_TOBAC
MAGGKGDKGASRLRVGSWNIGMLTGKSIELGKILQKRKINIACVQETKRKGTKARDVDGFNLWLRPGCQAAILAGFGRGGAYYPAYREAFHGGDFNGHIGTSAKGYDYVHGGFGFGDRNEGGTLLLDFSRAFDFVIAN